MPEPRRVTVQDVRKRLLAGDPLLLVCIYDQEDWDDSHLEGSISLADLERRAKKLKKDHEIVFY